MAKKIFVGNLSWDTTDDSLNQFFSSIGTVTSAKVMTDKFTGRSRGFGFVEMASDEDADKAINELNGQSLDGRNVAVNEARPREERNDRPRSFDRGGNRNHNGGNRDRRNY